MSTNPIVEETTEPGHYLIWCPACDSAHQFTVPPWGYDGNAERPTVTGSILVTGGETNTRCHSFVTQGTWDYLSDCAHKYAGQTMEAIPFRSGVRGKRRG